MDGSDDQKAYFSEGKDGTDTQQDVEVIETLQTLSGRSRRVLLPLACFWDIATVSVDDPVTYEQAARSLKIENWKHAMN